MKFSLRWPVDLFVLFHCKSAESVEYVWIIDHFIFGMFRWTAVVWQFKFHCRSHLIPSINVYLYIEIRLDLKLSAIPLWIRKWHHSWFHSISSWPDTFGGVERAKKGKRFHWIDLIRISRLWTCSWTWTWTRLRINGSEERSRFDCPINRSILIWFLQRSLQAVKRY